VLGRSDYATDERGICESRKRPFLTLKNQAIQNQQNFHQKHSEILSQKQSANTYTVFNL
jgi:hypothetical protein